MQSSSLFVGLIFELTCSVHLIFCPKIIYGTFLALIPCVFERFPLFPGISGVR